jgi:superfamily II DNA or RNA helicase
MSKPLISTNHKVKLTRQGYIISKDILTKEENEMILKDLHVEPKIDEKYKKLSDDDSFNIYQETVSGKYILPRYYGIAKFGIPINIKFDLNELDHNEINFNGNLRDYQQEIMNTILDEYTYNILDPPSALKTYGGSIISIPPGKGKTVLAINLITRLKLRALVIVHKTFLLNQWKERIEQYTNATIGTIQQDKIDISNKQIVIGMLQSICMKKYDKELLKAFPLIIYDECHHLGAKMFSKSLMKVQAPFYLGLSATPERKDKLDKVFKYFLGDIKYRGKFEPNSSVKVQLYSFTKENDDNFRPLFNRFLKQYNSQKMITNLCKIDERNNLIISIIRKVLFIDKGRKILILTSRRNDDSVNHIKLISDKLEVYEDLKDNWGYYVGGMKRIKLEISSEKQIIIGTYEMAQEGLDIADLDTLILASPLKGNITQTCGRILRGCNVYQPLIIDIVDQINPFINQSKSRFKYYLSNSYKCSFYDQSLNEIRPYIQNIEKELDEKNEDLFSD